MFLYSFFFFFSSFLRLATDYGGYLFASYTFIFAHFFYFLIILFIPPSMFVMSSLLGLFGLLSTFVFLLALVI